MTLLEKLIAEREANHARHLARINRINSGDLEISDSFVSSWANDKAGDLLDKKIAILENGGLWDFECLCDLEGNKIENAKLCNTRFGESYRVEKSDGSIEWVNPHVKEKTLAKKGYTLGTESLPAWAKLEGSGTGLSGALSVYVCVFKSKVNMLNE